VASGTTVFVQPDVPARGEQASLFRRAAHTYQRVIADEAAEYQCQADKAWTPQRGDYGIMRPPFEQMWIEYKFPNRVYDRGEWRQMPSEMRVAVLLEQEGDDTFYAFALSTFGHRSTIMVLPIDVVISNFLDPDSMQEDLTWLYDAEKFESQFGGFDSACAAMLSNLGPAYLALGWMNCKGMGSEEVREPRWRQNKRRKHGSYLGLDYRRIVIDDRISHALESNRKAEQHGQRLHIVRGHIRTYTAERPAFGNYVGNMWIHPHVRGNADLGRINHEYHVTSRGPR